MAHKVDYSSLDYSKRTLPQRIVRMMIAALFRMLIRLNIEGLENVPASGRFLLASNHLHILDAPLGIIVFPRRMVVYIKNKWQKPPFSWLLSSISDVIYTGKSERYAFVQGTKVLQAGGVLCITPEGTRSRTGGLIKGQPGIARLATHTSAPILPGIMYGQEQSLHYWKKFRRVPVYVRIGTLIELPTGKANKEELEGYTDQIMISLASLLPQTYRGIYAKHVLDTNEIHDVY